MFPVADPHPQSLSRFQVLRKRLASTPIWVSLVLTLVAVSAILYWRKPDAFQNPQFWGEDATQWFYFQYREGISAITMPYARYMHLIPRLIAFFASYFPFAAQPAVFNYAAVGVMLLTVVKIFDPRFDFPGKPLLALCLVVAPHISGENLVCATGTNWIVAVLPAIIVLQKPPTARWQIVLDWVLIVLSGLSGPALLLLLPAFACHCWIHRTRYSLWLMVPVVLCSYMQLYLIFTGENLYSTPSVLTFHHVLQILLQKGVGQLLLGPTWPSSIPIWVLALVTLPLIALPLLWAGRDRQRLAFVVILTCFPLLILLGAIHKSGPHPEELIAPENGSRYFYLLNVMQMWIWIAILFTGLAWQRLAAAVLLAMAIGSSACSNWVYPGLPDMHWADYSVWIHYDDRMRIPTNPPGWEIDFQLRASDPPAAQP